MNVDKTKKNKLMVRAFAFAISLFLYCLDHACEPCLSSRSHTLTVDKHNVMRYFNG